MRIDSLRIKAAIEDSNQFDDIWQHPIENGVRKTARNAAADIAKVMMEGFRVMFDSPDGLVDLQQERLA
jgi:hypothetical protein